jgi:cardiolipin synthase A/B
VTGDPLTTAPVLMALVVLVAVVTVVIALVTDDRDPSIVLAWLFVIVLVPVLGVVAYFFLGRNHRGRASRRVTWRTAAQKPKTDRLQRQPAARRLRSAAGVADHASPTRRVESTALYEGGTALLPATSVRLYFTGAEKFRDLFTDLRGARKSIHLMYLIWERDGLTAEITAILLERMSAGVHVYVMYDWLSSLPYRKNELRALTRAGATVVPCYRRLSQINYRNHMKMAVVDRRVLYSGGMNMGQEYVDGGSRFRVWRDTHYRLTGPVVAAYLSLFGSVWMLDGHGALPDADVPYVETEGGTDDGVPVQVVHSSVSTCFPAIRDVFLVSLATARSRVWIQSPYFVPDEPLLAAMCVAAASGVDVRLMMTGVPDKKLPFRAAHAYFGTVLASGVRVFTYEAGFLHAKVVTVDEELAVVGTCNWDIRSLALHDEVVAVFYDTGITRMCAEQYERDLSHCKEVSSPDLDALGMGARLRNHVCRLFSRLL